MIKDTIKYNDKSYSVSTINENNIFETVIFPIMEKGVYIHEEELYSFRTIDAEESKSKHEDIKINPDKYLTVEAIASYKKSMEKTLEESDYPRWKNWLNMYNVSYTENTFDTHRKALDIEVTDCYCFPYIIFDMWGRFIEMGASE